MTTQDLQSLYRLLYEQQTELIAQREEIQQLRGRLQQAAHVTDIVHGASSAC